VTAPLVNLPGRCAWRITMLPEHRAYLLDHPGLLVAWPEDGDDLLAAARELPDLPVMLCVAEPTFARQLSAELESRLAALGRPTIEVLTLQVKDPAELKSGGLLQTLFAMREAGRVRHIGLATHDVLAAEWLALNTAARVLQLPWSQADQSARYRAVPAAIDYGMTCIALQPTAPRDTPYALAAGSLVHPLLDRPIDADTTPLTAEAMEESWRDYQQTHAPPPPLPRSRPPEDG
jgi:hypothetical protein